MKEQNINQNLEFVVDQSILDQLNTCNPSDLKEQTSPLFMRKVNIFSFHYDQTQAGYRKSNVRILGF